MATKVRRELIAHVSICPSIDMRRKQEAICQSGEVHNKLLFKTCPLRKL